MIDYEKPVWRAEQSIYRNSVDFLVIQKGPQGRSVGKPTDIMMSFDVDPGTLLEPTLSVRPEEAQQIINELWRIGFRPKDGSGAIAHTEAMQSHLADMRKLAFHALKVPE